MQVADGVRGRSVLVLLAGLVVGLSGTAGADEVKKPASNQDGKYLDADGAPTYNIGADGKVDWYAFSGYRRYHSECHVCHGPDGAGSTYAPALADSLKSMDYYQFAATVAQGRKNVSADSQKVMPSFAENKNVMCYLDDIYVYLKARADGALPRIRPESHEPKPDAAKQAENSCMGF